MKQLFIAAFSAVIFGCAASPVELIGEWGGDHIALSVGESFSALEFDCASGSISGPFFIGVDGSFALDGVLAVEHGGPVRAGENSPEKSVRYLGVVTGARMHLAIEGDDPVRQYKLEKGRAPQLTKCL